MSIHSTHESAAAVPESKSKHQQPTGSRIRILYISYDGILEPLGFSQVFRYIERLADSFLMVLISFEKPEDMVDRERLRAMRIRCAHRGVIWRPLRYHKRPTLLATAFDIISGLVVGIRLSVQHKISIVHARSYVASVIGIVLKVFCRLKYIFDMRGFWADERVEGGIWPPSSLLFNAAKWFEKQFLLRADAVVSLTNAAVREMNQWTFLKGKRTYFTVIPTCVDTANFLPPASRSDRPFVLGYVGSVGLWYDFDPALELFRALRETVAGARLMVLNRDAREYIQDRLLVHGIPLQSVSITSVQQEEMPRYIAEMSAGTFFVKPTYSKKASAPTKFAEFLACGIPCVVRAGIGDMDEILARYRVGVSVPETDPKRLSACAADLLELLADPELPARCRRAALEMFSLDSGVRNYASIYECLSRPR